MICEMYANDEENCRIKIGRSLRLKRVDFLRASRRLIVSLSRSRHDIKAVTIVTCSCAT